MELTRGKIESVPESVTCPVCNKPMQIAEDIKSGNEVVARRFVCFCRGLVAHWTWHAGQAPETRSKP